MKLRKWKNSLWTLAAAEVSIAAQLLFFLPPASAHATGPAPAASPPESGEAALALLKVETTEPPTQEEVTVNKTVPDVEPPPQYPAFSPIPTDAELTKARVFGEPLIPEAGEANDSENQALAQAIVTYLTGGDSEALEPLEGIVTTFPQSRWRVAIQANVGSWYRRKGYFTRAQRNLNEAWRLGRSSDTEGVRRLAEFAAGELMVIHMQFGQVDPLEALVADFAGRELSGGITEKLYAAQATVWGLRNDHENAIPSGSVALERLRKDKHDKAEKQKKDRDAKYPKKAFKRHQELDEFPATMDGASLAELQDLADLTDLRLQMARRIDAGAEIPVPSVAHLKQGHFAAVAEVRGGRIRLDDPLLGGEVWMSREAFDEEASGFFLIEQRTIPHGWRRATRGETASVRGKCVFAVGFDGATRTADRCKPCKGDGLGMAGYAFHLMRASLSLYDNPVGYAPPVGAEVRFRATYNQREANQPTTFFYSNLGPRWVHNWMSYIEDDPTAVGDPIELYVRSGGRESYEGFVNNVSEPQQDIRAVMTIVSTSPIKYERELPDGSIEVFAQSDGASTAPRRIFLTEVMDPQGNTLTLTYDNDLRLVSVTDAIDQVTTISYGLTGDPLKITKVTDPFGRSATIEYNEDGQLIAITDVIGLRSEFEYGLNVEYQSSTADFVRALTTPYGTTTFRTGTGPYASVSTNRWVEATDPLGGTERVEHILAGTNPLPATDAVSTVPKGFSGNLNLDTHLSIYYSKLAMHHATTDPPEPTSGEITRFRSSSMFKLSGYQIQSVKTPLENRVWYEHAGETSDNSTGASGLPVAIGRVLDDGSSQIYRYEWTDRGLLVRRVDPLGRTRTRSYDGARNLIEIARLNPSVDDGEELLSNSIYNQLHRPTETTSRDGHTTSYTYNGAGQTLSMTTPEREGVTEPRTTTYTYDNDGYLLAVSGPDPAKTTSYAYDAFGRVQSVTVDGFTKSYLYDALDRPTRTTFPDGSYEQTVYSRLDAVSFRDRSGRWRRRAYDALRRPISVSDAAGNTTIALWCPCGQLQAIRDASGMTTAWQFDVQGRVTSEARADGTTIGYSYEDTTSRLERATDGRGEHKDYEYFLDDRLKSVSYPNASVGTSTLTFTYDPVSAQLRSSAVGSDITSYTYHAIGSGSGAGALASVDGPLTNDKVGYEYDAVGRVRSRSVNGIVTTYTRDALGRVISTSSSIGTFQMDYVGAAARVDSVQYPNGQLTKYSYSDAGSDFRLEDIHHYNSQGASLSRFSHTYDSSDNVISWRQQADSSTGELSTFEYDRQGRIRSGTVWTDDPSPTLLKRFAYDYDAVGNRTAEQIDDATINDEHDAGHRLTSKQPGGGLVFAGDVSEPATVSIDAEAADVSSDNEFRGTADVESGMNTVELKARDYSGNERVYQYSVSVSGSSSTLTHDANGNLSNDGLNSYLWDGRNKLTRITRGSLTTDLEYNAWGQVVRLLEKDGSTVTADRYFIWCGSELCEERDSSGSVIKRFYQEGVEVSGSAYYFTRDHLNSIRELTDASGALRARYAYDPYGRATKVSGDKDSDLTFTGHLTHASGLVFTAHRVYDPTLGRWLSRDPSGLLGGTNPYLYVDGRVVSARDAFGLQQTPAPPTTGPSPGEVEQGLKEIWEATRRAAKAGRYARAAALGGLVFCVGVAALLCQKGDGHGPSDPADEPKIPPPPDDEEGDEEEQKPPWEEPHEGKRKTLCRLQYDKDVYTCYVQFKRDGDDLKYEECLRRARSDNFRCEGGLPPDRAPWNCF